MKGNLSNKLLISRKKLNELINIGLRFTSASD